MDDAIAAYIKLSKDVFSDRTRWPHNNGIFKASRLEDAVMEIIHSNLEVGKGEAKEIRMLEAEGPKWQVALLSFLIYIDLLYQLCLFFDCTECDVSDTLPHIRTFKTRLMIVLSWRRSGQRQQNDLSSRASTSEILISRKRSSVEVCDGKIL